MRDQFEPLNPIEYLNNIGTQKIYEKTHIAKRNLELLFAKQFDKLDKIQAIGFVSIIQREYKIDLSALKEEIIEYYDVKPIKTNIVQMELEEVKKSKNSLLIFLFIVVAIAALFYFYQEGEKGLETLKEKSEKNSSEMILDALEKEKQEFEELQKESNITQDEMAVTSLIEPVVLEAIKITPRKKVWLGYIDLDTYQKVQTTTAESIELDPNKRWLILFGHGMVDLSQGDELHNFASAKRLFILYEDGVIKEIGKNEYKTLNRGKMW